MKRNHLVVSQYAVFDSGSKKNYLVKENIQLIAFLEIRNHLISLS